MATAATAIVAILPAAAVGGVDISPGQNSALRDHDQSRPQAAKVGPANSILSQEAGSSAKDLPDGWTDVHWPQPSLPFPLSANSLKRP